MYDMNELRKDKKVRELNLYMLGYSNSDLWSNSKYVYVQTSREKRRPTLKKVQDEEVFY